MRVKSQLGATPIEAYTCPAFGLPGSVEASPNASLLLLLGLAKGRSANWKLYKEERIHKLYKS